MKYRLFLLGFALVKADFFKKFEEHVMKEEGRQGECLSLTFISYSINFLTDYPYSNVQPWKHSNQVCNFKMTSALSSTYRIPLHFDQYLMISAK